MSSRQIHEIDLLRKKNNNQLNYSQMPPDIDCGSELLSCLSEHYFHFIFWYFKKEYRMT